MLDTIKFRNKVRNNVICRCCENPINTLFDKRAMTFYTTMHTGTTIFICPLCIAILYHRTKQEGLSI